MIRRKAPYRRPRCPALPEDLPERIERLKDAAGISWREFAKRIGTEPKTVRRWRCGTRQPSSKFILALVRFADEDPLRLEILLGDLARRRAEARD